MSSPDSVLAVETFAKRDIWRFSFTFPQRGQQGTFSVLTDFEKKLKTVLQRLQ